MNSSGKTTITVSTELAAPIEKVWNYWIAPEHIVRWNAASDDWHSPRAINDARSGGKFNIRMEAKDGSMGFDFEGVYTQVVPHKLIEYSLGDDRKVTVQFAYNSGVTTVTETFDAENENSLEMQRAGWQAILNNFKKYVETP